VAPWRKYPKVGPRTLGALLLGGLLGWGGGSPAGAQSILVTPSFRLSEDFDSNINLTTKATSDFVTSTTPGLAIEFRDYPFTLSLYGHLISQFYASHSELNTYTDNIDLGGTFVYQPIPTLALSLNDVYTRNVNPSVVAPVSGVTTGRAASTSNTAAAGLSYQFERPTTAQLSYSLITLRSEAATAEDSDSQSVSAGILRELTPTVSGGLKYIYNRFHVSDQPDTDSHSPRVSLVVRYTPTITVSSDTGPIWIQRTDGSYELTYASSTRYDQKFSQGNITLAYSRDAGTGGFTGVTSVSDSVTGSAAYELTRYLTLSATAAWYKTSSTGNSSTGNNGRGSLDLETYTAGAGLTYRLLKWLTLNASYTFYRQMGSGTGVTDLDRHVFSLSLTASDQFRVY
jgi:hypothetical protein